MNFWNQREQNSQRTAFVNAELRFPLELLWMSDFGSISFLSPPIVVKDIVYICSTRQLRAFNLKTRDLLWTFNPQAELMMKGSPAFCQDRVFFSDAMGTRYGLNADTGELLWQDNKPRTTNDSFCVYDIRLFSTFAWRENDIIEQGCMALDLDGKILWKFCATDLVPMKGVAVKDNRLIVGDRSGQIWAIDVESGKEIWMVKATDLFDSELYRIAAKEIKLLSFPMIVENIVLAQVHRVLFAGFDLNTGELLWHNRIGLLPVGCNGKELIFFDKEDMKLCRVNISSGELTKASSSSVPDLVHAEARRALVVGNTYIAGFNNPQGLFAYDIESGQLLWRFETELEGSGFSSAPAFADNKLVIGSDMGKLYCFV